MASTAQKYTKIRKGRNETLKNRTHVPLFQHPQRPSATTASGRMTCAASFMNQDARQLNAVKPSRQDEKVFAECRTIVTALAQELGKIANPQT